jgi:hypothetical protein
MFRWTLIDPVHARLGQTAFFFLIRHWFIGLLILGGIIGWIFTNFRPARVVGWSGTGILAGVILSLIALGRYQEQYLAPVMVSLVLFVPFLFLLFGRFRWNQLITLILLLATIGISGHQLRLRARWLRRTDHRIHNALTESIRDMGDDVEPGIETLYAMQKLLDLIPAGERVVGQWFFHPIFRFDQTFITYDMGRDVSFQKVINPSNRVYQYFQPEYFARELENNPPGYICLQGLEVNYPPGWLETCIDFLQRHKDMYERLNFGGTPIYLRRDLRKQN